MTQKSPLRDEVPHSPLPWRLNDPRNLTTLVYAADGRTAICKMAGGSIEADADFLLRACNSHDALLAALKECRTLTACVEVTGPSIHVNTLVNIFHCADAAIAKAEGR